MTNLDSILKSKDITLPTKVCLVKAMVFPVVMCEYESWTIKKAECRRIDALELWWRLLKSPWDCKEIKPVNPKGNQSWIFIRRTDAKAETQYFGHLLWRTDSLKKTLVLGKIEGRRRRGRQRTKWLDDITTRWTWVWASSRSWWWPGKPGVLQSMGLQRVGQDWATELNWTSLNFDDSERLQNLAECCRS